MSHELKLVLRVLGGSALLGCSILLLAHAAGRVDLDLQSLLLGPGTLVTLATIALRAKLGY